MSKNLNLDGFKYIWTTHLEQIILVSSRDDIGYGIVRIFPNSTISSLIIEDNEVYRGVQHKLLNAGARVMSYEDFMKFKNNRS